MTAARLPRHLCDVMSSIDYDWTGWTLAGEEVIFLDLRQDRYFGLSEPENSAFCSAIARGELAEWHLPTCLPKPETWTFPAGSPPASGDNRLDLAGIAAAFWIQRRLERRIRSVPFHQLLTGIRHMAEDRLSGGSTAPGDSIDGIIADFERARLLRSAANRCVPRSLAFVLRCASHGIRAHAVIGVKSKPFEAHCWAQHGSVVLSDPLEHVMQFKPILVI